MPAGTWMASGAPPPLGAAAWPVSAAAGAAGASDEAPAPQPARALAFPLTATRPVPLRAPGFAAHVMRSH